MFRKDTIFSPLLFLFYLLFPLFYTPSPLLLRLSHNHQLGFYSIKGDNCKVDLLFTTEYRVKNALFLDFFPLWGNIYPYINRGAVVEKAVKPRCTTRFRFCFHGKSLCEIWHAFHLRMYFQNRSAKKEGSPRKIRNLLVILLG